MENTLEFLDWNNKNNKVQDISMEQLRDTHIEYDAMGRPMKQIRHAELFDNIIGEVQTAGYTPNIMDLFIANSGNNQTPGISYYPEVGNIHGNLACKAYVVRRAYLNLNLTEFDNDMFTTNLAVAYHQDGIQVGFGQNVKICHNQCMLSADQYIATYSDKIYSKAMPIERIMETIRGWLSNVKERVDTERNIITNMMGIIVPIECFKHLVGELQVIRVKVDSRNQNIKTKGQYYPLGQTQINDFTERGLLLYNKKDTVSLWDIYNCATYSYSDHHMDIPKILPQNIAMVDFLDEFYHFKNPASPIINNAPMFAMPGTREITYAEAEVIA